MPNGLVVYLVSGYNGVTLASGSVSVTAVISGNDVNVSGETVYLVNDGSNNAVMISGQSVYLVNDGFNNVVKTSGETARLVSGDTVQVVIRDTAGSLPAVSSYNSDLVGISTANRLFVHASLGALSPDVLATVRLRTTVTTSGEGFRLLVATSGQTNYDMGTTPKAGAAINCTAASGGTQLANISGIAFYLCNISGNAVVHVGSTTNPPDITTMVGYPLYGGSQMPTPIRVDNLNKIRVAASVSGQQVAWYAVAAS